MSIVKFLFFASGLMIFYPFIGYLLILRSISFIRPINHIQNSSGFNPLVTLLISAYNEEAVIEKKILNTLALNYPEDLLEIVIISDGSDDKTGEIVSKYAAKGILLRNYEGRIGKTACLNRTIPLAKGEIIVFSDANSEYDRDAIKELVKNFEDPMTGFVTGITKYTSAEGSGVDSIGIYSKMEVITKRLESRIGSCVGADGAIFAIRKSLYEPLKNYDINDFVIPMNVIKKGYTGWLESNAFCVEKSGDTKVEFSRQVRINNRTIRAMFNNFGLLNPLKFGFFSFELLSHKLCRLLVPFFMLIFFMSNLVLITTREHLYIYIFIGHSLFYLMAMFRYMGFDFKKISGLLSASYTFTMVNIAILLGWVKYLQGETFTVWSPTQR